MRKRDILVFAGRDYLGRVGSFELQQTDLEEHMRRYKAIAENRLINSEGMPNAPDVIIFAHSVSSICGGQDYITLKLIEMAGTEFANFIENFNTDEQLLEYVIRED